MQNLLNHHKINKSIVTPLGIIDLREFLWDYMVYIPEYLELCSQQYHTSCLLSYHKSKLKIFSIIMVLFGYTDGDLTVLWVQCTNSNQHIPFQTSETVTKDIITFS